LVQAVIPELSQHGWRQFCRSHNSAESLSTRVRDREEVVVARNAKGYIKGLCIYAVRKHAAYGRLIDVPFLIASSADLEGVTPASDSGP
jgi:hypothetical protein